MNLSRFCKSCCLFIIYIHIYELLWVSSYIFLPLQDRFAAVLVLSVAKLDSDRFITSLLIQKCDSFTSLYVFLITSHRLLSFCPTVSNASCLLHYAVYALILEPEIREGKYCRRLMLIGWMGRKGFKF